MERIILGIFRVQKVILSFSKYHGLRQESDLMYVEQADELCVLTRLQEWRDVRTVSYTKIPPRYIDKHAGQCGAIFPARYHNYDAVRLVFHASLPYLP
jgi:translation initiation factor 2B subunit (eIF-2B alpha/beta/delta family)